MTLPLTLSFISEMYVFYSSLLSNIYLYIVVISTVFLTSIYSLYLIHKVCGGRLTPYILRFNDLYEYEYMSIVVLVGINFHLGINSGHLLDYFICRIEGEVKGYS